MYHFSSLTGALVSKRCAVTNPGGLGRRTRAVKARLLVACDAALVGAVLVNKCKVFSSHVSSSDTRLGL